MSTVNAHVDVSNRARGLSFGWSENLHQGLHRQGLFKDKFIFLRPYLIILTHISLKKKYFLNTGTHFYNASIIFTHNK